MTEENMEQMKAKLLKTFNRCVDIAQADLERDSMPNRTLAAELVQAASEAAKAIVAIEREQRETEGCKHVVKLEGK